MDSFCPYPGAGLVDFSCHEEFDYLNYLVFFLNVIESEYTIPFLSQEVGRHGGD